MPRTHRCRAFTLIEVLVVVAIIALLVSILVPSLSRAREQAKQTVCMSNLKAIGLAAVSYINSERNRFCWGPYYPLEGGIDGTQQIPYCRTWYFGGNRGQDSDDLGTDGNYHYGYTHDWRAYQRPLNRHVYSGARFSPTESWPLFQEGPLRTYECPSDKGVRWNDDPYSELHEKISAYLEVGTSYQANNSWRYFARDGEDFTGPDVGKRVSDLMDRILKIFERKGPSRAILIYEDTADWALNADLPFGYKVQSWHNTYDIHNILFLDGHAAVTPVDYTKNDDYVNPSGTGKWIARHDYHE